MTNSFTIRKVYGFTGEARGFPGGSVVKNPSANVEATGGAGSTHGHPAWGGKIPLGKEMATPSSILA